MSYQIEQFRHNYRERVIPRFYSGILHLCFTIVTLLTTAVICFAQVRNPSLLTILIVPGMLLVGELAVFVIHKFPLHRPLKGLAGFTFKIHALQHHRFFTDDCVTWKNTRDFHIMLFPPFAIIGYVVAGAPLLWGLFWLLFGANAGWMAAGMGAIYFMLYETVHFCSHLPADHWMMKVPGMRFQREFHRLHHNPRLMATHNFGVVYPLWDYIFGTARTPDMRQFGSDRPENT